MPWFMLHFFFNFAQGIRLKRCVNEHICVCVACIYNLWNGNSKWTSYVLSFVCACIRAVYTWEFSELFHFVAAEISWNLEI